MAISEISGLTLSRGLAWPARVQDSNVTVTLLFPDGGLFWRPSHEFFFSSLETTQRDTFRHGSEASGFLAGQLANMASATAIRDILATWAHLHGSFFYDGSERYLLCGGLQGAWWMFMEI